MPVPSDYERSGNCDLPQKVVDHVRIGFMDIKVKVNLQDFPLTLQHA